MPENTAIIEQRNAVKELIAQPSYKQRFEEVLRERAPQFMASLVAVASDPNLAQCDPKSVIASAMIAATLDFPIEKSLGFAHIVPYAGKASFQMAAKGYIQLALRSGQYQRINARGVNSEAFGGYDEVGEPIIFWDKIDDCLPFSGYVVAWRLVNGFTKVAYWSKEKVEAHARRFSQAYKKQKQDSPWFTNFDKMALKTVVMNELRAWGVLSVQMQTAITHDMTVQADIDADPAYVDDDATLDPPPPARPKPPVRSAKGAAAAVENPPARKETQGTIVDGEIVDEVAVERERQAQAAKKAEADAAKAKEDAAAKEKAKTLAEQLEAKERAEVAAETAPAKPAEKPAEPVPAEKPKERAFLKDQERIDGDCEVVEITNCGFGTIAKVRRPCVQAKVKGAFWGEVVDPDGGTASADSSAVIAKPLWTVGKKLHLKLLGRLNTVNGRLTVLVESASEVQPASPVVDVD